MSSRLNVFRGLCSVLYRSCFVPLYFCVFSVLALISPFMPCTIYARAYVYSILFTPRKNFYLNIPIYKADTVHVRNPKARYPQRLCDAEIEWRTINQPTGLTRPVQRGFLLFIRQGLQREREIRKRCQCFELL